MARTVLTDEQIKEENKFLEGLPRINWGALLFPPIWGPVHGFYATILYYPAMLIIDNLTYLAVSEGGWLAWLGTIVAWITILAISVAFAIVSQPLAAHRAESKGISRERYLKHQRIWVVVSAILLVATVALATYYNINIRPFAVEG